MDKEAYRELEEIHGIMLQVHRKSDGSYYWSGSIPAIPDCVEYAYSYQEVMGRLIARKRQIREEEALHEGLTNRRFYGLYTKEIAEPMTFVGYFATKEEIENFVEKHPIPQDIPVVEYKIVVYETGRLSKTWKEWYKNRICRVRIDL